MTEPSKILELNGAITDIQMDKRTLIIVDEHGVTHPFKWTEGAFDDWARGQRIGYGLTVKYDEESRILKSGVYWKKPEGFNKGKGGYGGGKTYAPRNEKPMIYESVFKSCCDQALSDDFKGVSYEDKMARIWKVAEKISGDIVKLAGA